MTNTKPVSQPTRVGLFLRIFLRRRSVDAVLLSLAIACFPVKLGLDMVVIALFLAGGINLIVGRHRSIRLIDPYYAVACLAYALVAVGIGLYQGDVAQNIRWIFLPTYFALALPLFTGFALIRDPLRQMAIGARMGLLLAIGMAIFEGLTGQYRIGFGGNAANAAFVLCVTAVMARFVVRNPPRYLPNTKLWFYLALIPVMMTGTRSVLPIFLIGALIDAFDIRRDVVARMRDFGQRRVFLLCLAGLIAIGAVTYPLQDLVKRRFSYTIAEVHGLSAPANGRPTGLNIRIVLWKGATRVFLQHPFIGLSGNESMALIKQGVPAEHRKLYMRFDHVHFFILDELRTRGLVGLFFMLGLFSIAFGRIFSTGDRTIRVNTLIFLSLLLFYGSMHGLFLGDRNIAAIALMFTALLAVWRKQEIRDRIHRREIAKPPMA